MTVEISEIEIDKLLNSGIPHGIKDLFNEAKEGFKKKEKVLYIRKYDEPQKGKEIIKELTSIDEIEELEKKILYKSKSTNYNEDTNNG